MIYLEPGLYLRVQQVSQRPPHPLPLENGFSVDVAYRAIGVHSPSETSECYFILANDREEAWFISNRHFRVVGLFPEKREMRFSLTAQADGVGTRAAPLRKVATVAYSSAAHD